MVLSAPRAQGSPGGDQPHTGRERSRRRAHQRCGAEPDCCRPLAAAHREQDYLLWIGRIDPVKGADRAIEAARLAGRTLVLAGLVQTGHEEYFRTCVEPHMDGWRVHYVGEVARVEKQELYANAAALPMPIRWREPFGMVMVEALAYGTPVIAFPEGAATEIVIDRENGKLVADETEMARAIGLVGSIDPVRCRSSVAERHDISITTAGYEQVYRRAIDPAPQVPVDPHGALRASPFPSRQINGR